MRCACIDIGSNTTRLLVAEASPGRLEKLAEQRAFTHLRRGVGPGGALAEDVVDELAAVVLEQVEAARALNAAHVLVVATAAVRRARDNGRLAGLLADRCGVELRVLSEAEEARLAFIGACGALRAQRGGRYPEGKVGVVDVGGGSSELVVGTPPDRISWSVSREVGSGVLADACLHSDPPTPQELAQARRRAEESLAGVEVPHPDLAVAVGGSAASLRPLAGDRLDRTALQAAVDLLLALPAEVIARRFDLNPERVRLLPAGLVVLQAAQERFGVALQLVGGGLREGVLMELAGV